MKDCDQTTLVNRYADGEMSPEEAVAFESHLAGCDACAAELANIRSLSRRLDRWQTPELSAEGLKRMHRAIAVVQSRRVNRFAAALSGIAAMLALAAVLWPSAVQSEAPVARANWEHAAIAPAVARTEDAATTEEVATAQWVLADLSSGARFHGD